MLSDCVNCRYSAKQRHHSTDIGCAIAPHYWEMWNRLHLLSSSTLQGLPIDFCGSFETDERLSLEACSLTLSREQWEQLSTNASLSTEVRAKIRQVITWHELEAETQCLPSGHIQMMSVVSSNISAIGYSAVNRILQVDFCSGSRYQYFNVPEHLFISFSEASSKGSFFQRSIRNSGFSYERIE